MALLRVAASAERALWDWLHPLTGGPNKTGWPFWPAHPPLRSVSGARWRTGARLRRSGRAFGTGATAAEGVDMSDYEIAAKDFVRFQTVDFSGD